MKASEVIKQLQDLMAERGIDPDVYGQSSGCCNHGHPIEVIEYDTVDYDDSIIIRV